MPKTDDSIKNFVKVSMDLVRESGFENGFEAGVMCVFSHIPEGLLSRSEVKRLAEHLSEKCPSKDHAEWARNIWALIGGDD